MDITTSSKIDAVSAFLYGEGHLLDAGEFDAWLSLFDDDGYYWVPVCPADQSRQTSPAIFDADKAFLEIILNRLKLDNAYSYVPAPRTCRLVSNVVIVGTSGNVITVRSKLHYEEYRTLEVAEDDRRTLAGTVVHELVADGDSFRILSKRVDLIQSEASLSAISAPL